VVFPTTPHLSTMVLLSMTQCLTAGHGPQAGSHGTVGEPGRVQWTAILAVRASSFVWPQVSQQEALRAALVPAWVPHLLAQLLRHKVTRVLQFAPTDRTGATAQTRRATAAQTVAVKALQDGRPQQLIAHRTLQRVPEFCPEFLCAICLQSTTTRPRVLPDELR
jgi:hypothetical protein